AIDKLNDLNKDDKLYFQQKLTEADWSVSFRINEKSILQEAYKSLNLSLIVFGISLLSMILLLWIRLHNDTETSAEATQDQFRVEKLTNRERQVIEILIQGKTDKEIAGILNISAGTVYTHLKRIYQKTNSAGRLALINKIKEQKVSND
ncbi:MAG: helix-turn-helix transcriptional regulator, partial [Deferribacteraceae bacterium]|nr:helix-turn-helix transcriptional regulator [Deferribacteraceae bacterium]